MTTPIEDYALIGDSQTAALVAKDGSIDWLCLPRFDSAACFSALLGTREHGRWLLGPTAEATTTRSYRGDSNILDTFHETATGRVRVTDLMPTTTEGGADIIRRVEGLEGEVEMLHEWIVRFGYGRVRPWVSRATGFGMDDDTLTAVAGPDTLILRGTRLPKADKKGEHGLKGAHRDTFVVRAGQAYTFSMTHIGSHEPLPEARKVTERIVETQRRTEVWASKCTYEGPYRDAVMRSLLVLRMLTDLKLGGIVAAPTTSLPEDFGGVRNWDYRFCWLRDASLTLDALLKSGYIQSTKLWRNWLVRAIAGDPEDMQIMYAVDGGRDMAERELPWLPGYADSKPVRIGNGAVDQRQTDVLGEVMIALENARSQGLQESKQSWAVQVALVNNLAEHWDEPDNGLWEIRGPLQHFTHSRVMVWAAFDRAIKGVEEHGYKGPVERWRELRDAVRAEILDKGWNAEKNTFTQHYDTTEVDASLLLIPLVGFLPPDDPKVLGTIAAIEHDLMRGGFLLRYRTESGVDGLAGDEYPFLACSWWLVSAYAVTGQLDKARELMDRLVGLLNDVHLIAEEYDTTHNRMAGNFPQAFSHLTLINAAYDLAEAEERAAREA